MKRLCASAVVCIALAGCGEPAYVPQAARTVDGFVVCESCTLEIVEVDTLEIESVLGIVPGYPADVDVSSDGRIAATFQLAGEPLWFDRSGTILGPIGRTGDGPGEYRRAKTLVPVPDSLVVFESVGRITVIDLETGRVRTLRPLPFGIRDAVVVSWPHRVAITTGSGPPADSIPSLTLFDLTGEAPEVVEVIEGHAGNDYSSLHRRLLASGVSKSFWALDRAAYRLVRRDSGGRVMDELRRNADWAPDGTGDLGYGPANEPPPRMTAVHQDSLGRVWTAARTTRPDWELAWSSRGITELSSGDAADRGPPAEELWDTRVEVFSSGLDSLLASEPLPGIVIRFLSDGRLLRYSETDLGLPIIELLRVRVDDRNGPGVR